jgi:hypothetical protein
VAREALLAAWKGEFGGQDPARAHWRFVASGVRQPPESRFREAFGGWVLGSRQFLDRLRDIASTSASASSDPPAPESRHLSPVEAEAIFRAVADFYRVERSSLSRRHDCQRAREAAAWLVRRHTEMPLRERAALLGLSRADSVPNLTRRLDARLRETAWLSAQLDQIVELARASPASAQRAGRNRKTKNQV